jgi:hypothetical protein
MAVDFVAVAAGDLELLDLVPLSFQVSLELVLILPLGLVGGGAFGGGEGQGVARARDSRSSLRMVKSSRVQGKVGLRGLLSRRNLKAVLAREKIVARMQSGEVGRTTPGLHPATQ